MQPRAVVTGGAGFLGSHLVESLLDRDIDVLCLDSLLTGAPENIAHLYGRRGFEFRHADVADSLAVSGRVDYVLHFASPASPVDYAELPIETLRAGSAGTHNALELARKNNARFLLASTSEVYGEPLVHPQPERYWGNVNSRRTQSLLRRGKTVCRGSNKFVSGKVRRRHGHRPNLQHLWPAYAAQRREGGSEFYSAGSAGRGHHCCRDGSQTRSMCYVDDLVDGIFRLLFSELTGPVNIGNPHELSMLQIAELVREISGSTSQIRFIARPVDDPTVRRPDITLAQDVLGWVPTIELPDGLARTITWFRDRLASDDVRLATAPLDVLVTAARDRCGRHRVCGRCHGRLPRKVGPRGTRPRYRSGLGGPVEPGPGAVLRARSVGGVGGSSFDRAAEVHRQTRRGPRRGWLCLPLRRHTTGPDGAPDLAQIEEALLSLAPYLHDTSIVINKSTVPVGAGNWTRTILEETSRSSRQAFQVVLESRIPSGGLGHQRLLVPGPDRARWRNTCIAERGRALPAGAQPVFYGGREDFRPTLITTDLPSAEMIKYAANAFLATKISFANGIANLSELVGADARQVLPAIGADTRIGSRFLSPGVGWGGSCFGKDVAALVATGQEYGYNPGLLRAAVDVNVLQRAAVLRKLQRELRVLKGRRVALLGLAFKPGTDDLRDAPSLDIARRLIAAGSTVAAYDPVVKKLPDDLAAVRISSDVYDAANRADALVVTTEWPEFRHIDVDLLARVMAGDLVIDGRNVLPQASFTRAGLRFKGFGW